MWGREVMRPGVGQRGWRQDVLSKDAADGLGYQNILPLSATTGARLAATSSVYLLASLPASHVHVQPPCTSGSVFTLPNTVPWVQRAWSHLHALEVTALPTLVLPGLYHQFHVLHDSPEKGTENMPMWEAGEGRIKKPSSRQWDRT